MPCGAAAPAARSREGVGVRVLVVGGGAREHALCWRLAREDGVHVWAAPGNPGMRSVARCVPVAADDAAALADVARREGVDLVVVGPEGPLVDGVADALRPQGLAVLGPGAAAARIEGSKRWAMAFCRRHGIPAPAFEVAEDVPRALELAARWPLPVVCKADGLMAGKGVVVAETRDEALAAARLLAARGPVVFEEFLAGVELSAFALCDGQRVWYLGEARDHKRLLDGDRGPMTGGMGAFAPVPELDEATRTQVRGILRAAVAALAAEGVPFVGFLFAGLMLTAAGPRVLEFNCRLGDPEAQALLPLLAGPIAEHWLVAARGGLPGDGDAPRAPEAALGVVLASPGYPEAPRAGGRIQGLCSDGGVHGALCFHAATALRDGEWTTTGGRVLTVVGRGSDLATARSAAYRAAASVQFAARQWRGDIGLPPGGGREGSGLPDPSESGGRRL